MRNPELWAGAECSVVRVGDQVRDQVDLTGHDVRLDDLDRLAALGVRAVRQPVLWERVSPVAPGTFDWQWSDARLERLRQLDLRPIVGLLHHGSGPSYASFAEPGFPTHLAAYAGSVARRYPWVEDWTPVNEPLTTARFASLYGLWYPHARSDRAFVTTLLRQLRGTALAMQAIRQVNPAARLIQTEDLGYTHSTPRLRYQAEFENNRRWLSFDFLCGRVTEDHPCWDYLRNAGAARDDLLWFARHPCPPQIVGINHYLTSERFLDERLTRYPPATHGGNHADRYADIEAVRVLSGGPLGPRALLEQVCERYALPVAVTEVHNGCSREEQLRWLVEVWSAAAGLRAAGRDVVAVTLWSAFGAVDWNSLLTRQQGLYESGAWDVRGPQPRPTALAHAAAALAAKGDYDHPVLDEPGWWRRPQRLLYPPFCAARGMDAAEPETDAAAADPRVVVITGATGTLGRAFATLCRRHGLAFRLLSRHDMDIADPRSVAAALDALRPWAVINAAGYVRVADAEGDREACWRANVHGPETLARACRERGLSFVTFSSDLVFDGRGDRAYVESDITRPTTVYGHSKAAAEDRVRAIMPEALIIRSSAFFGPWDIYNLPTRWLHALTAGEIVPARTDVIVSPTYVPDLASHVLDLLVDGEQGLWHLANVGALSWYELAIAAARHAAITTGHIQPHADQGSSRHCTALDSERGASMPPFEDALARFVAARPWHRLAIA